MSLAEEVAKLLVDCLTDFRDVNESGFWHGHPFTWQVQDLKAALPSVPKRIAELEADNANWQTSFDLYDKAIRRGSDEWRKSHPEMDCWPDMAEMVKWLCERNAELEAIVRELGETTTVYVRRTGDNEALLEYPTWVRVRALILRAREVGR